MEATVHSRPRLDGLGVVLSVVCAVHCLAGPAIIATLPFAGIALLEEEWVERAFLLAALLTALVAVWSSWRVYRHWGPVAAVGLAVCSAAAAVAFEPLEEPLTVLAAALLGSAHLVNLFIARRSGLAPEHR